MSIMINDKPSSFTGIKISLRFQQFRLDKVKLRCNFNDDKAENHTLTALDDETSSQINSLNIIQPDDSTPPNISNNQILEGLVASSSAVEITADTQLPGYINVLDIAGRPVALEVEGGNEQMDEIGARDQKFYICVTCGKLLATKRNSLSHSYLHTGEKRFDCGQCDRKYFYRASLARHIRMKHFIKKPIPARPFTCTTCGKRFASNSSLRVHRNTVHPIISKYSCNSCGKGFYYRKYYREHMKKEMRKNLNLAMLLPKNNMLENFAYFGNFE